MEENEILTAEGTEGAGRFTDGREESHESAGVTEAKREAEVREFMETFPEAAQDPRSIPPEVWAEVRNGRSLVAAYGRYSAAQVRTAREAAQRQEAARRLNGENTARSTGSMRSAGEGNGARDPFLEGWEE